MISSDQFRNLPNDLIVAFSSREDGSVLDRTHLTPEAEIRANRQHICEQLGIDYGDVVFQKIVYSDDSRYDRLVEVGDTHTTKYVAAVAADGLLTTTPGVALFLPVADCIVTVLYDPTRKVLAQLHMGRHSSLTGILEKTVQAFLSKGCSPENIRVWMAPAATKDSYKLGYFDKKDDAEWQPYVQERADGYYLDLQGHNKATLEALGIKPEHITISPIDTMQSDRYFSHAKGDTSSRFAGVAMIR